MLLYGMRHPHYGNSMSPGLGRYNGSQTLWQKDRRRGYETSGATSEACGVLWGALLPFPGNNNSIIHGFAILLGRLLTSRGGYLEVGTSATMHGLCQLLSHLVLWIMALQAERMFDSVSDSTSQSGGTITMGSEYHLQTSEYHLDTSENGLRGGRGAPCVLLLNRSLASAAVHIGIVLCPTGNALLSMSSVVKWLGDAMRCSRGDANESGVFASLQRVAASDVWETCSTDTRAI